MKPSQLLVNAPDSQYPIIVEDRVLAALPVYLAERGLTGKVAVVTNETIAPLYGETLVASLRNAVLVTLPDGEQYKTLESVRRLYSAFFEAQLDRHSIVICLR